MNGKSQPEELLVFKFRKEPWSVYFKWIGPEGQGREVTYVKGQYNDQIHTLLAAGDMPFMAAGKRFRWRRTTCLSARGPAIPLPRPASGPSSTSSVTCWTQPSEAIPASGRSTISARKNAPNTTPPWKPSSAIPPGCEHELPHGGRRWLLFDPANGLPVLTITQDDSGSEVEYYCFDRLQFPVKLDDDDFNPDKLWPPVRNRR